MSKKESNNNINKLKINHDNELNKNKNTKGSIIKSKSEENYNLINQKNIQQDLLYFKDDILKDLRRIQLKLNEELIMQKDEQTYKLDLYEKKIEAQAQKIEYLSNLISESMQKTNLEELLEKFSNETEQNFSKVELKMNAIQKEIKDGLYKQEKFFNETVLYPGIIGYECRFSNFHSFVDYVLSNIHQLLVYQELLKGYELHKLKGKIEKDLNVVRLQLKNNFKSLSEFTTEKVNESQKHMKNLFDEYNNKFVDIRVENNEAANLLKNKINNVVHNFEKIIEIKNEIDEKYEEQNKKIENIQINVTNNEAKLNEQKDEINNFDKKFNLLTNYIDNNLSQNNYNNNMDKSRNNRTFKGRRVHSAKEYIEGWLNYNNYLENENNKTNKKSKKYNFKAESFIKRYIKGKIGIGDMYKHPKDFEIEKKREKKFKSSIIKLYKESLSEEKLIKNKINNNNNQQFFSLTTVKSVKSPNNTIYNNNYNQNNNNINISNKSIKTNKSNKSLEESIKLKSNINFKSNISLVKNNNIEENNQLKEESFQQNSKIYNKKNNQSYELKKHNTLSFNNNEKIKNLKKESMELEKMKNLYIRNNVIMKNSSSQTKRMTKFNKIDSVSRIPEIDINRISYPDKETKKNFLITKSLSDGNYNQSNQNKNFFEDIYEKKNKKLKQRIKYNNFKSPNNYITNRQTFGNKYIREQFAKEKIPNYLMHKPKKPLLIVQ